MKKFRDMTDSEKLEIINAMIVGDPLEIYASEIWFNERSGSIWMDAIYRIPKRPMSIDWSVLKDEYICAAMDKDGESWAYTTAPKKYSGGYYCTTEGKICCLNGLKSYDPGTVDWQDSLIWRPGYGYNK